MANRAPLLLVILGPTASGKSALAMATAKRLGGEILSVDSMTVYREMDIGTAKPTALERREVRHHLIDLVSPDETFTVARFVEMADAVIADCRARGVPLVATGGTPLYYKALFQGLFNGPPADAELRQRLASEGNDALHARLLRVDPDAGARIHVNDTKRLVRALEVYDLTGRPISSFQNEWTSGQLRHAARFVGLLWEKEALNRRINARVKWMFDDHWVDEVRRLLERYQSLSATASEATGYAQVISHLRGMMTLPDAVEAVKIATRQLARKQMKWFRRFENVKWLAGDLPMETLLQSVIQQTSANGEISR